MDVNEFILKLIILTIPGFLGVSLNRYLRSDLEPSKKFFSTWFDMVETVVYTASSVALYDFVGRPSRSLFTTLIRGADNATDPNSYFTLGEFAWLTAISIALAILMAIVFNYRLIGRLFQFLRVTRQYGFSDVWTYMQGTPNQPASWITFRDYKTNLTYLGYINRYSDTGQTREVLMNKVTVYDDNGVIIQADVPSLYISRKHDEFAIYYIEEQEEELDVEKS